jgi:hypothetical protein
MQAKDADVNRAERRELQVLTRQQAKAWPRELVAIPESEWPSRERRERPRAVLRSSEFLVQAYDARPLHGIAVRRLSVSRVTMRSDGRWDAGITWDDLQRIKHEAGYGDWYGVEIFPRDRDVVNVANMRHLWLLAEPLAIGWFGR